MDYIAAIRKIIEPIVMNKDAVEIKELPNDSAKDRTFMIICDSEDTGRLIGKHGSTAEALREVISIAGKTNNERVHLKFASKKRKKAKKTGKTEQMNKLMWQKPHLFFIMSLVKNYDLSFIGRHSENARIKGRNQSQIDHRLRFSPL